MSIELISEIAKEIYGKSIKSSVGSFLSKIQKEGIKGTHIEKYDSWDLDGPFTKGEVTETWLYDGNGLNKCEPLVEMQFYDGISSPYPRLRYSKIATDRFVINCTFGPRAGRGFICKVVEEFGHQSLDFEGGKMWMS